MQEIKMTFAKDGAVTLETSGFVGQSCKDATKVFKDALGREVESTLKSEYYAVVDGVQNQVRA